jgi:O-antigen/teichoic acid export membrane protein
MPPQSNLHTSNAIAWASVETLLRQGLQFGAVIVLARLLTPADFGLVAMLSIFTAFATLLVDSGFASALIQQREENSTDSSTVFWFNIGSGTLMALLLGISAPLIARFFGHTELIA